MIHDQIHIANLGVFDLQLPLIKTKGDGAKILIINNLHGNELTGFYVLKTLLSQTDLPGNITVVTTANPLGLLHKQRVQPIDYADLNRGYPPSAKERGIQTVLKEKLLELCLQHEVVIDLHTFVRPSLAAGMAIAQASEGQRNKMHTCFSLMKLPIVFQIDAQGVEEKPVASALGYRVVANGGLAVVVEFPPSTNVSAHEIDEYARGLNVVLNYLNDKKIKEENSAVPKILLRQQIINRTTGLFKPTVALGAEVKTGDTIGLMIDPKTLVTEKIITPYPGIVAELAAQQLSVFGEKLATIGEAIS